MDIRGKIDINKVYMTVTEVAHFWDVPLEDIRYLGEEGELEICMIEEIPPRAQRLTEKQLSEYWEIRTSTLQKWRSLGCGPVYMKIGGKVFYRLEDIEQFEKSRTFYGSGHRMQAKGEK